MPSPHPFRHRRAAPRHVHLLAFARRWIEGPARCEKAGRLCCYFRAWAAKEKPKRAPSGRREERGWQLQYRQGSNAALHGSRAAAGTCARRLAVCESMPYRAHARLWAWVRAFFAIAQRPNIRCAWQSSSHGEIRRSSCGPCNKVSMFTTCCGRQEGGHQGNTRGRK